MGKQWTEDQEATLRRLLIQGATDDVIAQRMGLRIGAVIGKRQRLKLACNPRRGDGNRGARGARPFAAREAG